MKSIWLFIGLALAGCGSLVSAQNQEAVIAGYGTMVANSDEIDAADPFSPGSNPAHAPKTPEMVRVQVEFIDLTHDALTKLLFLAAPQGADATALRKQLQEMVVKNEAKVIDTQIILTKSGHKAASESNHEFIYPVEFTPMTQEERQARQEAAFKSIMRSGACVNPATPAAFETRNLGCGLEIEPTVNDDNPTVDLLLVYNHVWHTGENIWHEGKDLAGNSFKISQPDFYTLRLNTSITCANGQYVFAAAMSPKNDKGNPDTTRKVMVLVKCDILAVK